MLPCQGRDAVSITADRTATVKSTCYNTNMSASIRNGAIAGYILGLVFAYAHTFLNFRYDVPLYLVEIALDRFARCTGRSCLFWIILSALISSLFWALVGGLIAKFIESERAENG